VVTLASRKLLGAGINTTLQNGANEIKQAVLITAVEFGSIPAPGSRAHPGRR